MNHHTESVDNWVEEKNVKEKFDILYRAAEKEIIQWIMWEKTEIFTAWIYDKFIWICAQKFPKLNGEYQGVISEKIVEFIATLAKDGCIEKPFNFLFTNIKNRCIDLSKMSDWHIQINMKSHHSIKYELGYENETQPDIVAMKNERDKRIKLLRNRALIVLSEKHEKQAKLLVSRLENEECYWNITKEFWWTPEQAQVQLAEAKRKIKKIIEKLLNGEEIKDILEGCD